MFFKKRTVYKALGFLGLLLIGMGFQFQNGYSQPENVVFILSDDHRYDYMNFHPESPDFLETPGMDRMAEEGAHLKNAFVSTSLCSPSRATMPWMCNSGGLRILRLMSVKYISEAIDVGMSPHGRTQCN